MPKVVNEHETWKTAIIVGLLFLIVAGLYWGAVDGGWVYDDCEVWGDQAVPELEFVRNGVSAEGLVQALQSRYGNNWQPISWWSHMLDAQVLGRENSRGFHAVNVAIHAFNTVLLYLLLLRWTKALTRTERGSSPTAIIILAVLGWALHPLRVESVAWLIERKDVLAASFYLITLLVFDSMQAQREGNLWKGALLLGIFTVLALGTKGSSLSLPVAMALASFFVYRDCSRAGMDKARLTLLYLPVLVPIGLYVLLVGGATATIDVPLVLKLNNALQSVGAYATKTIIPLELSYFYPFASTYDLGRILLGALLIVGILVMGSWAIKRGLTKPSANRMSLMLGWGGLWFLLTLIPMSGLVQVGEQGMADRYTYLPAIGISILTLGGWSSLCERSLLKRVALIAGGSTLVWFSFLTTQQIKVWNNEAALYGHAYRLNPQNHHALLNLALNRIQAGDQVLGEEYLQAALAFPEVESDAAYQLGRLAQSRDEPAEAFYRQSLSANPQQTSAAEAMAWLLYDKHELELAEQYFLQAISAPQASRHQAYHLSYAAFLVQQGRRDEAQSQLDAARLKTPLHPKIHLLERALRD